MASGRRLHRTPDRGRLSVDGSSGWFVRLPPMHGGEAGASKYGLNPELQKFIDSDVGMTVSLLSHTIGIFVFMFGVGYVAFRVWRPGAHRAFTRRDIEVSRGLVWGGLMVNGLGGAMRLAMSDHPTLTAIGTNPWVQLIFAKHLLWFALLGAGYLLLNRGLPQLVASGENLLDPRSAGHAKKTISNSLVLVLLIAIMGGAASVVGPAGMADALTMPAGDEAMLMPVNQTRASYFNGTASGNPATTFRAETTLHVPLNTTDLDVVLSWTSNAATMSLQVLDPGGTATGQPQTQGQRVTLTLQQPRPGAWKIIVSSTRSVQEPYTGQATVRFLTMESVSHSPEAAQSADPKASDASNQDGTPAQRISRLDPPWFLASQVQAR